MGEEKHWRHPSKQKEMGTTITPSITITINPSQLQPCEWAGPGAWWSLSVQRLPKLLFQWLITDCWTLLYVFLNCIFSAKHKYWKWEQPTEFGEEHISYNNVSVAGRVRLCIRSRRKRRWLNLLLASERAKVMTGDSAQKIQVQELSIHHWVAMKQPLSLSAEPSLQDCCEGKEGVI